MAERSDAYKKQTDQRVAEKKTLYDENTDGGGAWATTAHQEHELRIGRNGTRTTCAPSDEDENSEPHDRPGGQEDEHRELG